MTIAAAAKKQELPNHANGANQPEYGNAFHKVLLQYSRHSPHSRDSAVPAVRAR
jgi:hypothetical protein